MNPPDELSCYYAQLLEGTYDCVDRIVLNAYFPLGQTGGGLRTWWRQLRGSDADLDDAHLRDLAGTFSRRVTAYCAKHRIPLIEAQAGERKHELAEPHVPQDPQCRGLFLVITGNQPTTRCCRRGSAQRSGPQRRAPRRRWRLSDQGPVPPRSCQKRAVWVSGNVPDTNSRMLLCQLLFQRA